MKESAKNHMVERTFMKILKIHISCSLVVGIALALFPVQAQSEAGDACCRKDVTVGFQGKMCAYSDFTVSLAGVTATGPGHLCDDFAFNPSYTNRAYAKLKLDQHYQLTAGLNICITNINFDVPEGYALYVDGVERKTIEKTTGGQIFSGDGTWDVVVRKKCPCGDDEPGGAGSQLGSVIWEAGLGKLPDGRSAERISIREDALTTSVYTPAALTYSAPGLTSDVDVVSPSSLRQVKSPQVLADVVVITSSEYDVRFYRPADVGAKVGGVYTVSGQPFVTWKVKNPNPPSTNRLQILKVENSVVVDTIEYQWDAISDSWTLTTGSGTRVETRTISYPTQTARTETFTTKDASGVVASKSARTYYSFPWGEELVQTVVDPDGAALTTTYAYYENPAEGHRYRKLLSVTFPDGSWEKYDYDQSWNVSTILRPWKDLSLGSATISNSRATIYYYIAGDGLQFTSFQRHLYSEEERVNGTTTRMAIHTTFPIVSFR